MTLQKILQDSIENVLVPNEALNQDALRGLKQALDSVAGKYTSLDSVHVNGLKTDQVWVQVQIILEGVTENLGDRISQYSTKGVGEDADEEGDQDEDSEDVDEDIDEDIAQDEEEEEEKDVEDEKDEEYEDNVVDFDQLQDDYEESDIGAVEAKSDTNSDMPVKTALSEVEDTDKFDLAEFQQHVLQLENDDDDDNDQRIDFNAEIEDESDDEDMHFEDFFGPAPKKKKVTPKREVHFDEEKEGVNDAVEEEDNSDNLDAVMDSTRRDLFDDDEDDELHQDGEATLSKFEKQQQEIAQQIEELENVNIGAKEWGMRGEAQAKDRPQESLFTIQFERNTKAAPVITEESTQFIEDMIKERIKKQQFDDIPRRSEVVGPQKRELVELSEQKSQKSLAEQYEEDQHRAQNPDYYAKQDSAVMIAAHKEVVKLFTAVSRKLDALCSWQYTPRPAAPSLAVVSDAPSIAMEEAQPGTMSAESQLAPQEVYKSEAAVPLANQEMTTSMKHKRRREHAKTKTGKKDSTTSASSRLTKKVEMFSTLKRGNVTMIDKSGQKRDMRGEAVRDRAPASISNIKL